MDATTLATLRDCLFAAYVFLPALLLLLGPAVMRGLSWARPAPEAEWEDCEYLPLPARRLV